MTSESKELDVRADLTMTADQSEMEQVTQVENGLVRMAANGQPQWGNTAALAEQMAHYQAPGVSIAVIDEGKLAWARGYGVCRVGEGEGVTTQTLVHAASVAKSLSSAATLSDGYGLGVVLQNTSQGPKAWHTGTWGSCSVIWFYPQLGKGAVVMINGASGGSMFFEILLGIASAYDWPMN